MTIKSFCLCFALANIILGVVFAIDDYKESKEREMERKNESKRNKKK